MRTIVIALLANVVIALAKLIAGLASNSTAMLAEAAHSGADSGNEVFLAVGLVADVFVDVTAHGAGNNSDASISPDG
jgi:Co/Zn/Cd efflux system component